MDDTHPDEFFIFGMFRSGTTLLARMLNTHEDIVCASDPFRPFFNYFRYDVASEVGFDVEPYDPLGDYFADGEELDLFHAIQNASLDRPFPAEEGERLRERMVSHAEPFSPKITARLDDIQGETFREVYDDLLSHVPRAYGDGDETWQATKEVWSTEFVPALADTYPDSKFVLMMRDPRAVVASKNVQKETKYPWLFLIRQWRKLAVLAWLYRQDSELAEQVLIVRYEDLVQSPEATATRMCDFLDIDIDEAILNPGNFRDGHGDLWLQNTSYGEENEEVSFNTDSVDKWKNVLDDRTVEYVEQLCFAEMDLFNYDYAGSSELGLPAELLADPPTVPFEQLADWIQSHYESRSAVSQVTETGIERVRQELLVCSESTANTVDESVVEAYFLNREYWETAREHVTR